MKVRPEYRSGKEEEEEESRFLAQLQRRCSRSCKERCWPQTKRKQAACVTTCLVLTGGVALALTVLITGIIAGDMTTALTNECKCNRDNGWAVEDIPSQFLTDTTCPKYRDKNMSIYYESADLVESLDLTPRGGSETRKIAAYLYRARVDGSGREQNGETIVITPGFGASRTKYTLLMPASMLAEMGFNVISIDTRSHGDSDVYLDRRTSWGCTEHKDTLGAWDWAVENLAGGDTSRVGIQGASLGGHISQITFGIERRIPGMFLDSAVYTVARALETRLTDMHLAPALFLGPTLHFAEEFAKCEIRQRQPPEMLEGAERSFYEANSRRKIGFTSGLEDSSVPWEHHGRYMVAHARSLGYNVTHQWVQSTLLPGETCDGCYSFPYTNDDPPYCGGGIYEEEHVRQMLIWPGTYRRMLCEFWSGVFDRDPALCGLDRWPNEATSDEYRG